MKTILFLLTFSCALPCIGQDITGVYPVKHTVYENTLNSSKNFSELSEDIVILEIENYQNTYGTLTIVGKTKGDGIVLLKFRIFGSINSHVESGYRIYSLNAKMLRQGVVYNDKSYSISFAVGKIDNYLILNYSENSYQIWTLGNTF